MKKIVLKVFFALAILLVMIPAITMSATAGTYAYCIMCGGEDVIYCEECEECLGCKSIEFCVNCEVCEDCIPEEDWCDNDCGNHFNCDGNSVEFTDCLHYCYECAEGNIYICSECNLCEQCVEVACEECLRCTECAERYSEDCNHCADCYPLCEMCNRCAECEALEFCRSCGNCEICVDMCPYCYEYCADCITVCEECGTCVDCAEAFCWGCNRCSDCVDVCTDCREYCADCVAVCEDCGACEYCVGDQFCVDCGVCSECAYICEDCGEICENCADAFCENCNSIGSCCEEICAECGLCDVCVTVCPDCQAVCDNCGTLCDVCRYCEDCCICDTLPHFIEQPKDGEVVTDDGKAFVYWRTNFVPKQLLILKKGNKVVYANLPVNKRTYEVGLNEDPGYIVRAYYGTGTNEYVDSNVFYVKKVAPSITLCDEIMELDRDTYLLPGETFKVSWELNFTPVRQYIEHDSEFFMEIAPTLRTYDFPSVSDGGNYVIVAYYTDEKFMSSDEFFIYAAEFTQQPVGGTVEKGQKLTVNWYTSFTPAKLQLISYTPDGGTETTGLPYRTKTIDLDALPEGGYYQIRAYFSGSRYVDSDKFYVSVKPDTYNVYFHILDNAPVTVAVEHGKLVEKPTDPTQEGKVFQGWYTEDDNLYDFSTPVTGNLNLYAKFADKKLEAPVVTASSDAVTGKPTLTWAAIDGAVKYDIFRSTSQTGTYTSVGTTAELSFMDTSAPLGGKYYYRVKAIGSINGVESAYSSTRSAVSRLARPVVTIKADAVSGKPVLTWKAVDGATRYAVYYSTSSSGTYTALPSTTRTSYTHSAAETGTKYYYRVRSIHPTSTYSSAFSPSQSCPVKLARPVVTIKADAASGKPVLTWNAVEGATRYAVYYSTSSSGTYTPLPSTTRTSYTHSAAETGTKYYYRVRSIHPTSTFSSAFSPSQSCPVKLARPVVTIKTDPVSGKPVLTWKAVDGATRYAVYYSTSSSGTFTALPSTTRTSYTHSAAEAGTKYYYRVKAIHSTSTYSSAFSPTQSCTAE